MRRFTFQELKARRGQVIAALFTRGRGRRVRLRPRDPDERKALQLITMHAIQRAFGEGRYEWVAPRRLRIRFR